MSVIRDDAVACLTAQIAALQEFESGLCRPAVAEVNLDNDPTLPYIAVLQDGSQTEQIASRVALQETGRSPGSGHDKQEARGEGCSTFSSESRKGKSQGGCAG